MGKYSQGLEQALKDRQAKIEAAVIAFIETHKTKLPFDFVEIKAQGDITIQEIFTELKTDPDFQFRDHRGDQRDPGGVEVKYVRKIYSQSDR